jgi:hypothetical protein
MKVILGPKIEEATGRWRKLHNDELHSLYSSPDSIRFINRGRCYGRRIVYSLHRETKGLYVLVLQSERSRSLGRRTNRLENIKECHPFVLLIVQRNKSVSVQTQQNSIYYIELHV